MAVITINVTVDFSEYVDIKRYAKKNQPLLLRTAAERYLRYLTKRYISLSAGGGDWPPLADSTIAQKTARGSATPEYILRETDVLLESMSIVENANKITVGYHHDDPHPNQRGSTIIELVKIHDADGRDAVALPDPATGRKMAEDIKKQFRKEYNKRRRRGK